MTTIAMRSTKDAIEWASDSAATSDGDQATMTGRKVFARDGILYGVAGSLRFLHAMEHSDLPPIRIGDDIPKWLTLEFVPTIAGFCESIWPKSQEDGYEIGMIVAIQGAMYEIDGGLGWLRRDESIVAIGTGSQYALGAMHAGKTPAEAVGIAKHCDPYTGGRIDSGTHHA